MVGILAVIAGIASGVGSFLLANSPVPRFIQYELNKLWPNLELDPETLVMLYLRGHISLNELKERCKAHGLAHEKTEELLKVSKRLFSIENAIYAYRRKIITYDELKAVFNANGIDESEIEKYIKVTEFFPSPSDIIRFAVREVFTEEIVEKYKMYEDLPLEFLELASQVGIPELVAKWYWYAHWELPSLTMAFEMFRRKIINEDELKTLMRTLDIMPFWRDKLLQLAYEIPTRVDVRRMYEMGIIDRNKVKEYYEKMGYTPEDAEILTKWTEVEYATEDKQLTVKQILELFELGEFTREEAIYYLNKLGYSHELAEYKITLYEHERLLREAKEQLNLLLEEYKSGLITYDELVDEAFKLPFSPTTIQRQLIKAYREKEAKTKLPSLNTLKKWLKLEIITIEEFKNYLSRLGYRDEDIEKFVLEVMKLNIDQLQSVGE
ncbi:MAG: hypothetical protein QXF61_07930 [Nitrososphaeria archaeon]